MSLINNPSPPLSLQDFRDDAARLRNTPAPQDEFFDTFTGNQWMDRAKLKPIPRMLFDAFWFEGELSILFADTNLGKSILAVQISDSISRGVPVGGLKMQAARQPVLYFDFELSEKQFEARYSADFKDHYVFDDGFYRAGINPDADYPDDGFEEFLHDALERTITRTGIKVLIIDNITYLRNETEKAASALTLMKQLKNLKNKYGLSILALAHTPKRDLTKPLTRNDLQGSKMLINFCDSAFTIGESTSQPNLRYLKQIKARNTGIIYHDDNICLCTIGKPVNFLQFEFDGYGSERMHLRVQAETDREELVENVRHMSKCGSSQREIANALGISLGVVNKYLKE